MPKLIINFFTKHWLFSSIVFGSVAIVGTRTFTNFKIPSVVPEIVGQLAGFDNDEESLPNNHKPTSDPKNKDDQKLYNNESTITNEKEVSNFLNWITINLDPHSLLNHALMLKINETTKNNPSAIRKSYPIDNLNNLPIENQTKTVNNSTTAKLILIPSSPSRSKNIEVSDGQSLSSSNHASLFMSRSLTIDVVALPNTETAMLLSLRKSLIGITRSYTVNPAIKIAETNDSAKVITRSASIGELNAVSQSSLQIDDNKKARITRSVSMPLLNDTETTDKEELAEELFSLEKDNSNETELIYTTITTESLDNETLETPKISPSIIYESTEQQSNDENSEDNKFARSLSLSQSICFEKKFEINIINDVPEATPSQ